MCGIAGIVDFTRAVERAHLDAMAASLGRRGPVGRFAARLALVEIQVVAQYAVVLAVAYRAQLPVAAPARQRCAPIPLPAQRDAAGRHRAERPPDLGQARAHPFGARPIGPGIADMGEGDL